MEAKSVREILLPFQSDLPLFPRVEVKDRLSHAVEIMLENNLGKIVVFRGRHPVGRVELKDALRLLGLKMPLEPPRQK